MLDMYQMYASVCISEYRYHQMFYLINIYQYFLNQSIHVIIHTAIYVDHLHAK